jgi:hypothetical protein
MQRVAEIPKPKSTSFDPLNVRRDFPIPANQGLRQAPRLPRQRRDDAEARTRHRRDQPLLRIAER